MRPLLEQTEYWPAVQSVWACPVPELNSPKLMHGFALFQVGYRSFQAKCCLRLRMTLASASLKMIGKTVASDVFIEVRGLQK